MRVLEAVCVGVPDLEAVPVRVGEAVGVLVLEVVCVGVPVLEGL